jgi:hypothetical protein
MFEFLDFYHIYEAFFDLNIRYRSLVINSPLPIKINLLSISRTSFQRYYTSILIPSHQRIKSLYLSNPFIIERLLLSTDTSLKLIGLEKLSLVDFNPKLIEELIIHLVSFPRLFSLVIDYLDGAQSTNNIYRQIFRLPVLKYYKLSCRESDTHELLPIAKMEFSSIEHLVINDYHLRRNEIYAVLSYVPQLRFLSLSGLCEDFDTHIIPCAMMLRQLTHVYLDLKDIMFDKVELMIKNLFLSSSSFIYFDTVRFRIY